MYHNKAMRRSQKFRAMKPLVTALLEGYEPHYLGCVEEEADAVGVWTCAGAKSMTCVANVNNLTFTGFARLCYGDYGKRPTEEGHMILAVNPAWTRSSDIGQLWDRKLKQQAKALIDDTRWETLFYLRCVGRGGLRLMCLRCIARACLDTCVEARRSCTLPCAGRFGRLEATWGCCSGSGQEHGKCTETRARRAGRAYSGRGGQMRSLCSGTSCSKAKKSPRLRKSPMLWLGKVEGEEGRMLWCGGTLDLGL